MAFAGTAAQAQTATPDMFSARRVSQLAPPDSPLRRTAAEANDPLDGRSLPENGQPAPLRTGPISTTGVPAANGAAATGYDSLNRKRQKPKYYPAQARPKPPVGPGSPPPPIASSTPLRLSIPPSETAHKTPLPPAMAGTVAGQPPRKRLRIDDDPFGAVGDYAGSFLIKSAVEVSAGYDTNPGRLAAPQAKPFYVIAPEFLAVSDWERHALVADLRGSFTGYGSNLTPPGNGTPLSAPLDIDRPFFNGHVDGRIDVSRDTRLTGQGRLFVSTDNPGSPNVQAGLARYPVYTTLGSTIGVDQTFNRLQVSAGATVDRIDYTNSKLTDGQSSTNDDRNYTQYGGIGRVSYELRPGLKPFAEVQGDSRVRDVRFDRTGFARDSSGGYAKAGTSFEFTRLLTGEVAVGYAMRDYVDPRLDRLEGLLVSSSLVWTATPLTTARFISDTTITETTLPGTSGVLTHIYTVEVDHDFRRWLTAIGKFTWGSLDYQGNPRRDKIYTLSGEAIYKMTRNLWLRGTLRRDWLESNIPGNSSASTVVMLGVRLQN
ncbi:MAG: outer membrane beta-barrel protein [Bradyrhizobium sp.]